MKFAAPFLLITTFALTACDTLNTRRSLYAPAKASGPYTEARKTGSWRRGEYPVPHTQKKIDDAPKPPIDTDPEPAPPAL